jgi:hypothetical protein
MSKKDHSLTLDSPGQVRAKALAQVPATAGVAIRVTNVQELYDAVENPHNAGASIFLRGDAQSTQTYVLTRRLLLQRDMKLFGIIGDASAIEIDTRSLTKDDLSEAGSILRFSSIGVGLGTNAIEWLTIIGNSLAAGGIGSDLPGSDPTTIRIANVVSGDSGTFDSRGVDIRNLFTGRKVTVEIEACEFFGQKQGIRFANFPDVEAAQIQARMRNNHSHGNRTGCLIVNNGALSSKIKVRSSVDTFDDNAAGCVIYGGFGASKQNFARFEANESRFVNNRRTLVDTEHGGIVVVGGRVLKNEDVASNNHVELRIEDCTIEHNQNPSFVAYGARNTTFQKPHVAGKDNTVFIELAFGDNELTHVEQIPSDPSEGVRTNTVRVVKG